MKVKDLMVPVDRFLSPDMTLKEAVNIFQTARRRDGHVGVKALPVLDSKGKMAGMFSMHDILKAIHPNYLNMMNLSNFTWDGMLEEMASKVADRRVGEFMTGNVLTVHEKDSLMECVDLMLKHSVKRLVVIDSEGRPLGMIYERDVFYAIVKSMIDK